MRTNLILHHGVTDIIDHATKLAQILYTVQEPRDFASLFQWDEILKDTIQFAIKPCASDRPSTLVSMGLPFEGLPPLFLFDLTLRHWCTQ